MKNNQTIEAHVLSKYQLLKKLGSGAYGHVWKVKSKSNGNVYALKKIFDAFQHSTDAQRTFREISVLKKLKHDKIIGLQEVIAAQNNEDIYLIFQYMESDLYHLIYEGKLQPIHIKYITYQLLLGLHFMHACNLIHRDLKPSNLLLNSNCSLKICDFGLVRSLSNENKQENILTEGVATRWYRAPEVLLGSNSYGTKADIWSVGCIIAQILLKNPMFPGNCTTNQLERVLRFTGHPSSSDIASIQADLADVMINQVNGRRGKKVDCFSKLGEQYQGAITMIQKMLQFNPNKRPSALDALKHPYLSQFYNHQDLEIKKQVISMEVDENIKLDKGQYLAIIKQKFVQQQKVIRGTFSRGKTNNSPKRFSDLKNSRRSSVSKSRSKIQDPNKSTSIQKPINLFKQLCQQKENEVKPLKTFNSFTKQLNEKQDKQNKYNSNKKLISDSSTKKITKNQQDSFKSGLKKVSVYNHAQRGERASFTGLKKGKFQKN